MWDVYTATYCGNSCTVHNCDGGLPVCRWNIGCVLSCCMMVPQQVLATTPVWCSPVMAGSAAVTSVSRTSGLLTLWRHHPTPTCACTVAKVNSVVYTSFCLHDCNSWCKHLNTLSSSWNCWLAICYTVDWWDVQILLSHQLLQRWLTMNMLFSHA